MRGDDAGSASGLVVHVVRDILEYVTENMQGQVISKIGDECAVECRKNQTTVSVDTLGFPITDANIERVLHEHPRTEVLVLRGAEIRCDI